MTTQTLQAAPMTGAASPRVNLMPPEIAEAARFRQVQALLGVALLVVVLIVGFLYWNAHSKVSDARDQLAQAQQQQTSLQAKLNSLASVRDTFAAVQARQSLLAQAMGTEVRWSFLLNDLSFRMPSNVWLTSMAVTESAPASTAPTAPQSLGATSTAASTGPVPIGTITFNAVGLKHDDVATWLDAMAKEKTFLNPIFTSSSETTIGTRPVVNFAGQVTLNSNALSHRFDAPAQPAATTTTPAVTTP
ncbi:MAG TPA: PilN domain-containing protein [Mycobacteriales bacterium]|nr:PilN domain-containing protein [Mycobacteriales bacterium]